MNENIKEIVNMWTKDHCAIHKKINNSLPLELFNIIYEEIRLGDDSKLCGVVFDDIRGDVNLNE